MILYEKPRALRQISTDEHGIIAASAGTGKTYTLQHLVIEILLGHEDVRLDEILLVTFTVAATSDLKAKIRETLDMLDDAYHRARARGLECAELTDDGLREWTGGEAPETHWVIDREGVERLRQALRNFDRAAIYTIHGFCQRILVEHAFANRRLFEQEHVSEEDVIDEAFAEMLREDVRPGTEAEQWLTAYLGAGNDIDQLRKKLVEYVGARGDYRPVESLELEQFDRFASRLASTLRETDLEEWNAEVRSTTDVHGNTVNAVVKRIGELKENFLSRFEPDRPIANLFALQKSADIKYFGKTTARTVLESGGQLGGAVEGIEKYDKNRDLLIITQLGDILKSRVEELKSREGYFTFADMVGVVRDTLYEEGENGHLLESIRDQFRYGLIDEFQDTDSEQWDIFRKVFIDSPHDDRHFLYVIGDPKQAIYGFRGGDVYTYISACESLKRRGVEPVLLTDNYRSTHAVLDACNAIFDSTAGDAVELGRGIEYAEPVQPGKPWLQLREDDQFVDTGVAAFELTTGRESISPANLRAGLVDCYAREIAAIVNGDRTLEYRVEDEQGDRTWEQVGAEDIFVLCRRRRELHRMAEVLRNYGVPFAFLKMPGLFQTAEAEDIYELLLALDAPYDRSRRARAWMTPFFDLRIGDLEGLAEIDEKDEAFARLLRWSRQAKSGEFTELFNRIVEESGLIRRRLLLERGERELTNYLHLFELLADEGARQVQTVEDLARRLRSFIDGRTTPEGEDVEQQRLETEQKAVQLLTIHAAKGLERGLVFVVPKLGAISKRRKPFRFHTGEPEEETELVEWHDNYSRLSDDDQRRYVNEAVAEELRLSYVAMTRAELLAYVPYAPEGSVIRKKLDKSPFSQIVERMETLRERGDDDAIDFRNVDIDARVPRPTSDEIRQSLGRLESFDVESHLVEPEPHEPTPGRETLLARRWEITSFSKQKQRVRTATPEDEKADEDDRPEQLLPGGMATGNFIHLVLEELDYGMVDEFERDKWLADDELREFFQDRARRFGRFDERALTEAMGMVYDTLCAPVKLVDSTLDGVRRLDPQRIRREIEFLFPVPEHTDGGWRRAFRHGGEISGGFATGVVDLLFEHDGRVYFADWKSDRAYPFDDQALADIVEERYATQANIYTLAVCRMLGVETEEDYRRDFGGYFYFFVRGMTSGQPGRGIFGGKLDWGRLVEYERGLPELVEEAKVTAG